MTTAQRQRQGERRSRFSGFGQTGKQDIPINTFQINRSGYYNIPEHQREPDDWSTLDRQLYIDTLLRTLKEDRGDMEDRDEGERKVVKGLRELMELSPIFFNKYWKPGEEGTSKLSHTIEDGLQRMTAIYMFLDGNLKTLNEKAYYDNVLVAGLESPPFDKKFYQLSPELKEEFLNRTIPCYITEGASPEIMALRYQRRNNHHPHTRAQLLSSFYYSPSVQLAKRISEHPLWTPMRENKRRKPRMFLTEMGLYIIYLHIYGTPFAQLNKKVLKILASGRDWNRATSTIEEDILRDLDETAHVFRGITVTAKTDAIALVQAHNYLRQATCDFVHSQEGCLASWFDIAKFTRIDENRKSANFTDRLGNLNVYAGMANQATQLKFWRTQKQQLLLQPGLVFTDMQKMYEVRDSRAMAVPDVRVPVGQDNLVLTPRDREEAQL